MCLRFLYVAMILTAAVIFSSCNSNDMSASSNTQKPASTPETSYADGARRITTAELETLIKQGKAFLVDVRNQDAYDLGHIPDSRLIPAGEILDHLSELPRDKTIVTYCS